MEKFTLEDMLGSNDWNRKMLPKKTYQDMMRLYNIEQAYIDIISIPGYKMKAPEYQHFYNFILATNEKVCELENAKYK